MYNRPSCSVGSARPCDLTAGFGDALLLELGVEAIRHDVSIGRPVLRL